MYYGTDKDGNRVYIGLSRAGESYFCPACKGLLIRKLGTKVAHHYAHKSESCDSWDNATGKSAWHREMQEHFPEECREVCMTNGRGEKHIADVFIRRKNAPNIVFEFQHSPISREEFDRRNAFYTYTEANTDSEGAVIKNFVIWVFDMRDKNLYIDLCDSSGELHYADTDNDTICREILREYRELYGRPRWYNKYTAIPWFLRRQYPQYFVFNKPVRINRDIRPEKGLRVNIHWKRPNDIFGNAGDNVKVFFDVCQRKYAAVYNSYTDDYGHEHEHELYTFLGESLHGKDTDLMYSFLVRMDRDERYYEDDFGGKCNPPEDFWNDVDALISKRAV